MKTPFNGEGLGVPPEGLKEEVMEKDRIMVAGL